ncbi:hypothetical protein [Acidovorax sp. SRB_24]|uniref:hypothetical protein n=1 Tax=Acidovorax sp. SRB_24 TaxID=1962700 RepID=UPI00145E1EE2|nr:hypothetical protein [Acidovorax sp. SRB_24]
MKKPLLTTIALAGTCAACCAVPLLIPIMSGLSVAGLIGLDWERLAANQGYMASVLGVVATLAVALGLWVARRRRIGKACASEASVFGNKQQTASSCGCSGPPKSSSAKAL